MNTKKALSSLALSMVFTMASSVASAQVAVRDGATPITDPAHLPVVATFSGSSSLTQYGIPVTCDLELTGQIDYDPENSYPLHTGASIAVTGGSVSGSGLCSSVTLGGFPWVANVPVSDAPTDNPDYVDPVDVTFNGVTVTGPLGSCFGNGQVTATFRNGVAHWSEVSRFTFSSTLGVCSINGTVFEDDHPATDTNVW